MATDVIMPQMGESIFEGTITRWLKQPGDQVAKDEPLFEISTDKVDAEIPAPVAGIVAEIRAAAGQTVTVNTVVAVIAAAGQTATTQPAAPKAVDAPATSIAGVDVVMPQMGESIFEGTITRWLKQVGEQVAKDEPLFEISTDKVDAEIPAPVSGLVTEIRAAAGQTVTVNTVVAVIGGSGASGASAAAAPVAEASAAASPQAVVAAADKPAVVSDSNLVIDPARRLRSSPLVRRIARENKIDLRQVPGTGTEGRITKADILAFLANPAASASVSRAAETRQEIKQVVTAGDQVQPMTKMRAIIAQRMLESKQASPHAHSVYKIDMTRIVRLRERSKASFEQQTGVKLTYMPFIAVAVTEALKKFPVLNASLVGQNIHYHGQVNLGIAVALEWGLIVPVVKQAEERSFLGVARSIADLAARARSKKLAPDEASGSTFTLTNSGIFGGEFGTPILNQPESAILAIGGLKKEPVVLTDAEGNDTIAIRHMQSFCLGFDHRIIDGADSGKFMATVQKTLETWDRPIL